MECLNPRTTRKVTWALASARAISARFVAVNAEPINQRMQASTLTLGELLYTDTAITCVPEKDWLALVRAIAAGEEAALRVLFEKAYPIVFTYLMRLTDDRGVTESLILEVFQDVWCEAPVFSGANGPVLGWIMRQARSSALAHARRPDSSRDGSDRSGARLIIDSMQPAADSLRIPGDLRLQEALEALTAPEREAIEAAFLNGLSYAEVAAQQQESIGTVKSRIRSGLSKLRRALQEQGAES
jgi:RNA polymerase sigma-70 factor (ECF subfamily)